ncbi:MAG: NADH-quinone oxidoreductase subunit NuoF [Dehalococcoidia bacterium]|nr:NADH-quinone oxidoreductase subunit NuoF [Dehalococcoidia bacterium]
MVTFDEIRSQAISEWEALEYSDKPRILVGAATCGRAAGATAVLEAINSELARHNIEAIVTQVGCIGLCYTEPLVNIIKPGRPHVYYGSVTPELATQLIEDYLIKDNPRPDLALGTVGDISMVDIPKLFELPMLKPQVRIALRNCGIIDPENINHYIARDGYSGLVKALEMATGEVIEEIKKSGLCGRGGAGFPTGMKWEFCRKSPGTVKYVICNADEGDPGAFMDRSLLEGDPHAVLEGILIGAYAIGASEGYIYIRAEYPLAIERLTLALSQLADYGLLGDNILGSDFSFHLKIKQGAGAFVCGEETALMASIEGKRGMPRSRPPFPAQAGLWGKPTNINNVETWGNVSAILQKGADWYAGYGSEGSKGTKTFALAGKIVRTGLIEVPMGIPLQEIIYGIGGGIPDGKRFKAVQTGGPSGGCLPASLLNLPVDYESLTKAGSIMGSGGMVVMDEDICMVDVAHYFLSFTQAESCGKCVPCRLGTKQMLNILEDITNGQGKLEDIDLLLNLGEQVKAGSLCGLGQTAPNPVLTTIRYFRDEYEEHIKRHHCQAAVCQGLVRAPCSHTCPAGVDAPRYIRFIAEGKFAEAVAVIREKIPFPSVCGHVCVHPCEAKCRRGQLDEAIGIRVLKRFATEHDTGLWKLNSKVASATGKRVAIVGSGPAGLTAAYYLAKLGHSVTVFEASPEPGGMMRVGIPGYRLPEDILRAEIKEIESIGVDIKTNTRVDSLDELFKQGYDAIFLAIGAHQGIKIGVEGEDSPGVRECVSFLMDVSLGKELKLGDRVAVIGGGNAAIDSARTALRLGAKEVTIVYRRTRAEMPASAEEIDGAIAEGVKIDFLAAPSRIISRDGHLELECVRMELGAVDASGRRRPEPIEGSNFSMSFDAIIAAIGQRPEIPLQFNLPTSQANTIRVDPDTLASSREGIFAGGDAISGPASVIEAIAAGRQAAISIDKYLGGSGEIDETLAPPEEAVAPLGEAGEEWRVEVPTLPVAERLKDFSQVELGLSEEIAIKEAKRCLRCDLEERE